MSQRLFSARDRMGVRPANRRGAHATFAILLSLALLCAGCNLPTAPSAPPPAPLTLTARPAGSLAPGTSGGGTAAAATTSPPASLTLPSLAASPTATMSCSDRATFIDDVAIPDGAAVSPGEQFVKVWRLQNAGTCPWTQVYTLVFFGGERMGAPLEVALGAIVPPGATIDLAVDMTAPMAPGVYQGFWRLRNPAGVQFGIGPSGDQSFWVKITVVAPETALPTITLTQTPSPTPAVLASGSLDLAPGSSADLDAGALNPASGADLLFDEGAPSNRLLRPRDGARLGLYSPSPSIPTLTDCMAAPLSGDAIPASALSVGSVVCYLTNLRHPGYLIVSDVSGTLSFGFLTWLP